MPDPLHAAPTVAFVTLGCSKNEVDTEAMASSLSSAGFGLTDATETADCVVINTCAFIEAAVEEAIDAILELADREAVRDGRQKLVVSGCLPARYGDELAATLPEVAAFVPCDAEGTLADFLAELGLKPNAMPGPGREPHLLTLHPSYAYVKISEGCDRRCTYCTIPSIRGPYRSFPLDAILSDVKAARKRGAREIDLIAQDTGRWGSDWTARKTLVDLVETLTESFGELWFRLLYVQPDAIDDRLLKALAGSQAFCHYLDVPIQHVDQDILRAMGRGGSLDEMVRMCERARELIDDVTLRTTLIVGFPGETPAAFDELCDFVAAGYFDYVGIFPFSPEEETVAAALPDPIDEDERLRRWQILRDIADSAGACAMERHIGEAVDVLIDEIDEDGVRIGHTRFQAPEVDGVTFVPEGSIGDIVRVTLTDGLGYDLEGR